MNRFWLFWNWSGANNFDALWKKRQLWGFRISLQRMLWQKRERRGHTVSKGACRGWEPLDCSRIYIQFRVQWTQLGLRTSQEQVKTASQTQFLLMSKSTYPICSSASCFWLPNLIFGVTRGLFWLKIRFIINPLLQVSCPRYGGVRFVGWDRMVRFWVESCFHAVAAGKPAAPEWTPGK